MIKALVSDFSRVILSPIDNNYAGSLNDLYKKLTAQGNYDFWKYFQVNQNLLTFYKTISKQIDIYIFTTEYIQDHPALQPKIESIFKYIFSSARLGLKKTDPQAYQTIIKGIWLKSKEVLYIDDNPANIDAAKKAGLVAIHYESNDQAIKDISKMLKK